MSCALATHVRFTETEDGGAVLLDQRSGQYWQLNSTGSAILSLLLTERNTEAAVALMRERYPSAADRLPGDVDALLCLLRDKRLVTP
ncbi:lasso peptide biosynthesis PqqD family chaperone [Streptomyces jumonjinensis]|uniref:lasso peptide biosynthesis PqqD family chaperone n=1 Tax=Streptomyces jumonjinensis TaxID=1945 RepID=UPI0037BD5D70